MNMNRLEIKGKHGTYLVNLADSTSVLKPSGEICSTYIGYEKQSGRRVVVKRYHPWVNSASGYFWRIEREAQATSACSGLSSELILLEGIYYLVTDYIEGVSFKELTRWRYHRKLNNYHLIYLASKALDALQKIHDTGFIHCDIKPSNIILTDPKNIANTDVRIIDYGLARKPAEPLHSNEKALAFGLIYSAPEQVFNFWDLIDIQTDIYSMGVTLWALFSRSEPWVASNPLKTIHVQLTQPLPGNRRVADDLMSILLKSTSKAQLPKPPHYYTRTQLRALLQQAKSIRYASAVEMLKHIEQLGKR
ncbi:MAG: protein kinase [Tenuifilum sp.]|uniref:serine/threonine protein kinase n=1 Tax=Tenuifilum sp. TaxID=2760880 RepID=UPI001B6829EA|nr:protein kinase [Bacteroidales bacterium]HOK60910.1 protein kinase [Tenuifilum sp.]MBP9029729.1 protein kinase [Bacteroidales bacterium]HOK86098.1 protein kinase [Tenuifilum sp.]HON70903.1 protein kinase [Tenuifilum sp.]